MTPLESLAADQQALLDMLLTPSPLTRLVAPSVIEKIVANNDDNTADRGVLESIPSSQRRHTVRPALHPAPGPAPGPAVRPNLARGLAVYRSNAQQLAARSLQAAYPVVTLLLGADSASALARALWHAHPPVRGDMAQWGADLADFMGQDAQLTALPYLPDVAKVEWALHCAATLADVAADLPSLQHLVDHDLDRLTCLLAPGVCAVSSQWPVATLMQAHAPLLQGKADDRPLALSSADALALEALFEAGTAQTTLVWRRGYQPTHRTVDAAEWAFVRQLALGVSLGASLDAAPEGFDFNAWLPQAVTEGLLLGMQPF
jgi:Putative DNA-binding domain